MGENGAVDFVNGVARRMAAPRHGLLQLEDRDVGLGAAAGDDDVGEADRSLRASLAASR